MKKQPTHYVYDTQTNEVMIEGGENYCKNYAFRMNENVRKTWIGAHQAPICYVVQSYTKDAK